MINKNITIENARLAFRNFAGKGTTYNAVGKRNFCVFLDLEFATLLQEDGWNIRWLTPREENEEKQAYIQVGVAFDPIPPTIMMITGRGKTMIDEANVEALDWAEFKNVDLIIRPYNWILQEGTKNEKRGTKAYLKTMYVTLNEDEFASKYYDIPVDSNHDSANN